LPIPNRSAIRDFGTSPAASLLINAQSSNVITLQPLSVHFSSAADNALTRFLRETPQLSFNPVRVAA
jgi:hypothetical protein